jgi:hypothetical protein
VNLNTLDNSLLADWEMAVEYNHSYFLILDNKVSLGKEVERLEVHFEHLPNILLIGIIM